jgi:hypothetical protein
MPAPCPVYHAQKSRHELLSIHCFVEVVLVLPWAKSAAVEPGTVRSRICRIRYLICRFGSADSWWLNQFNLRERRTLLVESSIVARFLPGRVDSG